MTGLWILDHGMSVKLTLSTDVKDDVEDRMSLLPVVELAAV